MVEYRGVAQSENQLLVGAAGLISSRKIRVRFSAEVPVFQFTPGQEYTISIEPALGAEAQALIDEELKGLTKAELVQQLMVLRKPELAELVGSALGHQSSGQTEGVSTDVEETPIEPD